MKKIIEETQKIKMEKQKLKFLLAALVSILIMSILSITIAVFSSLNALESFRIVFGSVYVLFLPGFIISFIFFSRTRNIDRIKSDDDEGHEKGAIDIIERIALSFALSIAIVPLAVFYLNLIGLKINLINSFLTILGIIIVSGIIITVKQKKARF